MSDEAKLRDDWTQPDPRRLASVHAQYDVIVKRHAEALREGLPNYTDPLSGLRVFHGRVPRTAVVTAANQDVVIVPSIPELENRLRDRFSALTVCKILLMTVAVPTTLDEAVRLFAAEPSAMLLAGGTDAMVEINDGQPPPRWDS